MRLLTLSGIGTVPLPSVDAAVSLLVERLYQGIPLPLEPVTEKTASKDERNNLICELYAMGDALEAIASTFSISVQRVHQIVCRRETDSIMGKRIS